MKTRDLPRKPVTCAVCGGPGKKVQPAQRTCGELRCIREYRRRREAERHQRRKEEAK